MFYNQRKNAHKTAATTTITDIQYEEKRGKKNKKFYQI